MPSRIFTTCEAVSICSPSTDHLPPANSPQFIFWALRCGISLWPVWVTCPGCSSSWLLSDETWETEKSLAWSKHSLATTKTSTCYQHYSHPKSVLYQLLKGKLILSQLKPGQLSNWHKLF